jgi:hypothetical protein
MWRPFFLEKLYTKVALGGYYYVKVGRVQRFGGLTTGRYLEIRAK